MAVFENLMANLTSGLLILFMDFIVMLGPTLQSFICFGAFCTTHLPIFHFYERNKNKHSDILPLLQVLLQLKRQKMADWPWWKMGKFFVQNAPKRIKLGKVGPNIITKSIDKISKPLVKFVIEFSKTNEVEIITTVNNTRSQLQPWRIL